MQSHRISAGALVERDGKLLLVRSVAPGRYDFWVSPGGGVKQGESLEEAAAREVWEETGLRATIGRLLYIEEFENPECRFIKFWFAAEVAAGDVNVEHPEAHAEHIVEAAWHTLADLKGMLAFPALLRSRYAQDKAAGFPAVVRLPLTQMDFW